MVCVNSLQQSRSAQFNEKRCNYMYLLVEASKCLSKASRHIIHSSVVLSDVIYKVPQLLSYKACTDTAQSAYIALASCDQI
jgi:hypothetical protein